MLTSKPKRRGDRHVLYDPNDGTEFLLPTSSNLEYYLTKGFHGDEKRAQDRRDQLDKARAEAEKEAAAAKKGTGKK